MVTATMFLVACDRGLIRRAPGAEGDDVRHPAAARGGVGLRASADNFPSEPGLAGSPQRLRSRRVALEGLRRAESGGRVEQSRCLLRLRNRT